MKVHEGSGKWAVRKVLKEINLCSAIVISTLAIQQSATRELTRDIASKLCPYNDFCHVKASRVLDDGKIPCCRECSCQDDCWRTSSCCYDLEHKTNQTQDLTCANTMVRKDPAFSDFMVFDGITHGIRRYFIHDKCPKHEKDEELKKACVFERVDSIDDLIWLSDVSSGEIYNNRHCAACHGVKEWRRWRIRTSSQNILHANFSNLADAIMSDECSIINELPEDEEKDAEKFRCFLPEVSVCNETGLWQQYDAAIEAACLQYYNVPFIQYEPAHHVIYKNVFCFICNQGESYLADEICSGRVISKSNVDSFNALIDFEAVQRTMKTAAERCAWDDIYDKYTGQCRKLVCPFGRANYNGECTSPALSLTNLGIYVGFHLKIDWSQSRIIEREAITLSKEDGMKTLRSFMRVFGLKKCNFCELHLRMDKEKQTNEPLGDLVIWTTFHTNANCQLENVYTQVRKVTSTQITVATGNKTLQLTMQLETRSLETIISENVTDYICAEFGYTSRRCYTRLRIIQTPCPAIELVIKEFMNIFDEKQGKSTNSIRRVAATDIVLVCVDKYLNVMKRIRSSAEHTEVSLSVFLLAAVMCFV